MKHTQIINLAAYFRQRAAIRRRFKQAVDDWQQGKRKQAQRRRESAVITPEIIERKRNSGRLSVTVQHQGDATLLFADADLYKLNVDIVDTPNGPTIRVIVSRKLPDSGSLPTNSAPTQNF